MAKGRKKVHDGGPADPPRVAETLDRFIGALHAARFTAVLLIQNAKQSGYAIAAKYGLQMTFGTTVLTLRKFQDLWDAKHLKRVVAPETDAWAACEWILHECQTSPRKGRS